MNSILKTITDRIRQDESENFGTFSPSRFELRKGVTPINIEPLLDQNFFVITEVKRGSPSQGIIRENFSPIDLACGYERGGASAVSVITEKNFFFGDKQHLSNIKRKVRLPVLRKDFLIHPFQIYESYNLGADFILLIAACLSDAALKEMYTLARSLGMQALVEVHNEQELARTLKIEPDIIGINNRNLDTFQVDMQVSFRLRSLIPKNTHVISESGIQSPQDIQALKNCGFSGVLIGETLLRQGDVTQALRELMDD